MSKLYSIKPGFKKARMAAGMTQQEVADRLGTVLKTVMNWEQGLVAPPLETVMKIADLFGCDIDYLTGRIEAKTHDLQFVQDQTGLTERAVSLLADWNDSEYPKAVSQIIENDSFAELIRSISRLAKLKQTEKPFTKNVIAHLQAVASGHDDYPYYDSPEEMRASYEYSVSRIFMRIVDDMTHV